MASNKLPRREEFRAAVANTKWCNGSQPRHAGEGLLAGAQHDEEKRKAKNEETRIMKKVCGQETKGKEKGTRLLHSRTHTQANRIGCEEAGPRPVHSCHLYTS
eukprot:1231646-Rhodomonas_salina.3